MGDDGAAVARSLWYDGSGNRLSMLRTSVDGYDFVRELTYDDSGMLDTLPIRAVPPTST